MTTHLVSDFDPADTDRLIQMWRESFEFGVGIKDRNPLERQRRYFEEEVRPNVRVQVVKRQDEIVAFLAAHQSYISQLYVRVGYFGQGIGSMLLGLAKEQSAGSLCLHTLLRNTRARRFYEHHGFILVGHDFEPMWQLESVEYKWCGRESAAS